LKRMTPSPGPAHPLAPVARRGLELTRELKRWAERYEQARAAKGADDANTLAARVQLALVFRALKNPSTAEEHLRAVHNARRRQDPEHPLTLVCQLELARTQMMQQKYAEAELLLRDWLTVYVKKQPDDWRRFNVMSLLGANLLAQKKYHEAEPFLTQSYEGIKKHLGPDSAAGNQYLSVALQRLGGLYDAWGEKDTANRWRKELEAMKKTAAPKKK